MLAGERLMFLALRPVVRQEIPDNKIMQEENPRVEHEATLTLEVRAQLQTEREQRGALEKLELQRERLSCSNTDHQS